MLKNIKIISLLIFALLAINVIIYNFFQNKKKDIVLLLPDDGPVKIKSPNSQDEMSNKDNELSDKFIHNQYYSYKVQLSNLPEDPLLNLSTHDIISDIISDTVANKINTKVNIVIEDSNLNFVKKPIKGYFLHLLSLRNPNIAELEWQRLKLKYTFLDQYTYKTQQVNSQIGKLYYLIIGPFKELNVAKMICKKLDSDQLCRLYNMSY